MILRTCPYQILKHKQCSHFLKTISSILNWLISRVKDHLNLREKSYHSIFNAINAMMIYPSALCSWFFNMYIRYKINSTQIYTYLCEECVCWVTTFMIYKFLIRPYTMNGAHSSQGYHTMHSVNRSFIIRAGVCRPCVEIELTATKKTATDGN